MRSLISVILLFACSFFSAQGFKVRPSIPAVLSHYSAFIYETTPGNYIAGGLIADTLNGYSINRLALMGLNSIGQVIWTKKYGNEKIIYVQNPFVRRTFYKSGNFIYYACSILDSNNKYLGGLIKFDQSGDTLWQKLYRDPLNMDLVPQMVTGSVDGGFLITGYTVINNPCLLIKTDSHGNELWRKKIGNYAMDGKAIVQDSASKKIVIVGYKYVNGPNSHENILIVDSLGDNPKFYDYGGFGGILIDLIQTKDKSLVAVGQKIYPQSVGGYNLIKSFAVKFNLNNPSPAIWKIEDYGPFSQTNNFNCVYELPNGDMLIGGDLDTTHLKNLNDNYYHKLVKIDKDGNIKWTRTYDYRPDTNTTYYQSLTSLSAGSNGAILASFQLYNSAPNPFFFVKYDSTGCDSTLAYCATLNLAGIKPYSQDNQITLFPNPMADVLNIDLTGLETENLELIIIDIHGREIKKLNLRQNQKLDVSDLSSGMYLVTLTRNKELIFKTKIIKE